MHTRGSMGPPVLADDRGGGGRHRELGSAASAGHDDRQVPTARTRGPDPDARPGPAAPRPGVGLGPLTREPKPAATAAGTPSVAGLSDRVVRLPCPGAVAVWFRYPVRRRKFAGLNATTAACATAVPGIEADLVGGAGARIRTSASGHASANVCSARRPAGSARSREARRAALDQRPSGRSRWRRLHSTRRPRRGCRSACRPGRKANRGRGVSLPPASLVGHDPGHPYE